MMTTTELMNGPFGGVGKGDGNCNGQKEARPWRGRRFVDEGDKRGNIVTADLQAV
jgi:hypothetical protein